MTKTQLKELRKTFPGARLCVECESVKLRGIKHQCLEFWQRKGYNRSR
jgi:hypothetical protein